MYTAPEIADLIPKYRPMVLGGIRSASQLLRAGVSSIPGMRLITQHGISQSGLIGLKKIRTAIRGSQPIASRKARKRMAFLREPILLIIVGTLMYSRPATRLLNVLNIATVQALAPTAIM